MADIIGAGRGVRVAPASTEYQWSNADQTLATSAIAGVAGAAIGAWSSHKLDKIRYTMEHDAYKYQKSAEEEARRQSAFYSALNKEKLQEAQMSERLALEIDSMKQVSTAQNQAAAANIENVPSIVRDINRETMRAEMYQSNEQESQMQQLDASAIDSSRSKRVLYDGVKPSADAPVAGMLTDTLRIGKQTYGEYTGQEMFLDSRRGKVNSQLI